MSLAQRIAEALGTLPPNRQLEVLSYVKSLQRIGAAERKLPRKSLLGALAHLNVHITREEIDEMRREAWANFPREDI